MSVKDVHFGFNFSTDTNVKTCMDSITGWNLTFACLPLSSLTLEKNSKSASDIMSRQFSKTWCHSIVAKIPVPLHIDSSTKLVRQESEKMLINDISWATFLNVYSIMFELPLVEDFLNLIRLIDSQIDNFQHNAVSIEFWILVPVETAGTDSWKTWLKFISLVRNVNKIKLVLEIGSQISCIKELDHWLGEPVAALSIQSSIFFLNKNSKPILTLDHQNFIKKMFNIGSQVFISGTLNPDEHLKYLYSLYNNTIPLTPYKSEFICGYEDYLQTPLQPLKNNLYAHTYETFEQDLVKYYLYKKAIQKAIIDKSEHIDPVVVYVVGAGRGPLVDATLEAASEADINIKVYAVEKNSNAFPTLLEKNKVKWNNCVTVIAKDMRLWNPEEKCDILVSELLGSFGDNELSPECLDGAQKYLKEDGISIPSSYTSYLSPMQSRKLHIEISSIRNNKDNCNFQKPYVAQLNNVFTIAPAKPLFKFIHPKKNLNESNDKDRFLTFKIMQDCLLHGFAGYFEAVLYKDVCLSIVPETFSDDMFSWFPIYFPLINPMFLNKHDELQIHFWRISNNQKVWYEWCVVKPYKSTIHNINGEMYSMSLS